MRRAAMVALGMLLLALLAACGGGRPPELVVSAAASLAEALKEIQPAFESQHPGVKIRFNFGSSGALQQQMEQGAPVDLFISAAIGPMERLAAKGIIAASGVQTLAKNRVVLIRNKSDEAVVTGWNDLVGGRVQRIAIGNPAHVPAGGYAQAVLEKLSMWAGVQPRLVLGEDVRQVLQFVESGEVDAGIVYATDAALSDKVVVIAEAPPGSHEPVVYPMAVVEESKNGPKAKAFADYLRSDAGQTVLRKYGFTGGNE